MTRKKRGATQTLAVMRQHCYSVYILTNAAATVFYVGMTNDLQRRIRRGDPGLDSFGNLRFRDLPV